MKVIIGLSGGVDSSVAAKLLLDEGYEVEGLFMRNWDSTTNNDVLGNPDLLDDVCPQEVDYQDALSVANKLGIKLHRVDFIKEYWENVFEYFLDEYREGRTPNPDVLCNKYIKFDAFIKEAEKLGADFIAMGHYAKVIHGDEPKLLRGVDKNKDQSYFLCQLNKDQLNTALFPIGDIDKSEVRKIAKDLDLATADKKDSTGICFIGERHFNQFLDNYLPAKKGKMVTEDGDVLGTHSGLMYYTIGQRKGLGIGGSQKYSNDPWFVIGKDLKENNLIVGQGFHHPTLYSDECIVDSINWLSDKKNMKITAKFRYRQPDQDVEIEWLDNKTLKVKYQGVRAVTPGQACVFYDGDVCLGGGFIKEVFSKGKKRIY
ncbi:tRNA 2-thiouridine(34) synthase MnmA [Mycoplasmatota bacterium zrk1]